MTWLEDNLVHVIFYGFMLSLLALMSYQMNMFDSKHIIDCIFQPHTNATGIYNYDC